MCLLGHLHVVSHVLPDVGILMIYSIMYNIGDTMSSEMSDEDSICRAIVRVRIIVLEI